MAYGKRSLTRGDRTRRFEFKLQFYKARIVVASFFTILASDAHLTKKKTFL